MKKLHLLFMAFCFSVTANAQDLQIPHFYTNMQQANPALLKDVDGTQFWLFLKFRVSVVFSQYSYS